MNIEIIRVSGVVENHEVPNSSAIRAICKLIGADCLDTVNLRNGKVMMVDDTGLVDGKPRNHSATKLYHGVCKPGTTSPICGDVAVVVDSDFA